MKRLCFHFEPARGWMNDPNGLVYFQGKYHAFFQHNPHDVVWDTMHWGHAVSQDLIHWEELPIALFPDQPYENQGGCFSGSAIVKDNRLYLIYTSVGGGKQTQSVAFSDDGIHFEKYPHNPVISGCPQGYYNFRDPKISYFNGCYHLVIGAGNSRIGQVLLYTSQDILHWEYQGVLYENRNETPCIECPDFFPLGDRYVLSYSRMGTRRHKPGQIFVIGDFNGKQLVNYHVERPEQGPDFYAGQTLSDPTGRRIMIGWMWNWKRQAAAGAVSAGALTLPRELSLQNDRLYIRPCREADGLLSHSPTPYITEADGKILLTNGTEVIHSYSAKKIRQITFMEDTNSLEFFINDGEESWTTWKAPIQ